MRALADLAALAFAKFTRRFVYVITGASSKMSTEELVAELKAQEAKHPRNSDAPFSRYGTSGYRDVAHRLDHVLFRMGLVAAMRSKVKNAFVGAMITASHNPLEDNGIKLVDPEGQMLETAWEDVADELVNSEELESSLEKAIVTLSVPLERPARVILGKDTRPSSEALSTAFAHGVHVFHGAVEDFGLLTTPQLHYLVKCRNGAQAYGEDTEEGYYKKLSEAFAKIRGPEPNNKRYVSKLRFDGANGVGAQAVRKLATHLGTNLHLEVFNDGRGKLNDQCGADFVKVNQRPPEGILLDAGVRCVSVDGDGDRIVYFYINKWGQTRILDGDKIAVLVAAFLKQLLDDCQLQASFGFVQTAYANGSSTKYAEQTLKVPVVFTPTGVKHLHHKATEFDVGVYFEANGHGTVVFSDQLKEKVRYAAGNESAAPSIKESASLFLSFIDLINETVGDAISDMLLIESILHAKGWSVEDWDGLYLELPNRLLKVPVPDRNAVVFPPNLQEEIDQQIVVRYKDGRSFVRPSGTENAVRIYAEAATQLEADQLAEEVAEKVEQIVQSLLSS